MIYNASGDPYNPTGSLQQYDVDNPEQDLFHMLYAEILEIYSSPIFLYEVIIGNVDPIYYESRDKIYSQHPVCLYALYEPKASSNFMTTFGVDSPDENFFELSYRDVIKRLGHPPRIGSRIFTPHKKENWRIIQCEVGDFKLWSEFKISLFCERYQESLIEGEGRVSQKQPEFNVDVVRWGTGNPNAPIIEGK